MILISYHGKVHVVVRMMAKTRPSTKYYNIACIVTVMGYSVRTFIMGYHLSSVVIISLSSLLLCFRGVFCLFVFRVRRCFVMVLVM